MRIVISIIVYIVMFSCTDIIHQKEKDLLRYDYLYPFIIKEGEYIDGTLNIDTNELVYYYRVKNLNVILNDIEKRANNSGWIKNNNIYEKEISMYNSSDQIVIKVMVIKEGELIKIIVN